MHTFRSTLCVLALLAVPAMAAAPPASVPYTWKSVQIVGGGFVDGIVFHPTAKDVVYVRTDIGGAYRRDPRTHRWIPLLDWVPYADLNLMGVESIAVDPSNPSKVYLACGTYTAPEVPDGAILRSSDQGQTFQRTNVPIKFGGNEAGRGNGERLAVDPNDGRILFLGTRKSGLWNSADGAVTWTKVATFPSDVLKLSAEEAKLPAWSAAGRSSIVFVVFDPTSGGAGKASRTLFAGVSVMGKPGLFRSDDAGVTWKIVPGQPTKYRPNHAILASDGNLFVSYGTDPGPMPMVDGAVWKLNTRSGVWTDITPDKPDAQRQFGYGAVSVDAHNSKVLIASSFHRPEGEEVFRSLDGGATWKPVFHRWEPSEGSHPLPRQTPLGEAQLRPRGGGGGVLDYALAPYVKDTDIHWLFDIEIDPSNSDHAMFTTGYGGWETYDLTNLDKNLPTHWSVMSPGIEETVALALYSPTNKRDRLHRAEPDSVHAPSAPLVTAIGDYSGFVHWELGRPAPDGNPKPPFLGNTKDVSGAELNPNVIVRVGHARKDGANLGYSLDGGKTWHEPASVPDPNANEGDIAVSSDGARWVWTPHGDLPYVTSDKGASWTACAGLPKDTRVVADRVNPQRFYAMALFDGKLFESLDGATHFTERPLILPGGLPKRGGGGKDNRTDRGDDRGGQDRIYATPGRQGDLWLAAYDGLYHAPAKADFVRVPAVEQIHAFGFGKAAPHAKLPALYLVGTVQGQRGFFRSTDGGATWLRINDDQHQWGLVLQITGDPKKFGRVYVGTHGRGTFYGDPKANQPR
ncbi:MAG TPA: sialidase family protein [Polyangia bacterium]|nr:sialidase family protein [Polyangia bacterium]